MANEPTLTDAQIEEIAREIYERFVRLPGWVPWVPNGNSNMQIEARASALAAYAVIRPICLREAAGVASKRAQHYAEAANRHDGTPLGSSNTDKLGASASIADAILSLIKEPSNG